MHVSRVTAWTMWFFVSMFYAYQYLLRVLPNVIMPELIRTYEVDAYQIGIFSGIYYVGYTIMHIPMGILVDKFGAKRIVPISIILTAAGLLPLIYSETWEYTVLGRLLIGIGSSASVIGTFKVIRMGFGAAKFSRILGLSVVLGLLGAIYGGGPVVYLVDNFGWRFTIHSFIVASLLLAFLNYISIPKEKAEEHLPSLKEIWLDIVYVLSNSKILGLSIVGGLMVGLLEGFADAWATPFLISVYELDTQTASTLPAMIFLGMCLGGATIGYIAEKTKAYYGLIFLCAFGMFITFSYVLYTIVPVPFLNFIFFMIGYMCAYQLLVIAKVGSYVSEKLVGIASASANMIIMMFGFVYHNVIGTVMSRFEKVATFSGEHIYPSKAYSLGLSSILIGLLLAATFLAFIIINNRIKKGREVADI